MLDLQIRAQFTLKGNNKHSMQYNTFLEGGIVKQWTKKETEEFSLNVK